MSAGQLYFRQYAARIADERLPMILIHGAGGSHLSWPPAIRRLPGSRVLALDLPGHGRSPGPGYRSIDEFATAVAHWMAEEQIRSAVVAGHSMGSAIAMTLALNFPQLVAGLVLVGAGARLRVAPALLEGLGQPEHYAQTLEQIVNWSYAKEAPAALRRLGLQRLAQVPPEVLRDDFQACDAFDLRHRLAEITVPTLVICGQDDQMTPLRFSQYLVEHLPQAELISVPAAGHMVMLEQPQVVAQAMERFLLSLCHG